MVFYGKQFWTECGVWDVVVNQARGRPYGELLLLSDSIDEIVDHLRKCAIQKNYRLLHDPYNELCNPYWFSRESL